MSSLLKSPYRNIFILSLLVYLITAFFSDGYYHPDEHFQILEFCNYKLGNSPASDLPWEYQERIRPALQPALAYVVVKFLNVISIYNPFTYALILRIITALLSWFIVSKSYLLFLKNFSSAAGKRIFLLLSFFLWFIPFISVRFSSENYAAITFLGALYLIMLHSDDTEKNKYYQLAFAGLLLGFSFFFRFQAAFAIAGLGLWLLLIKKMRWMNLFILIISGLCAMAFCVYLDFWFYGNFELTPVNYFIANIVENKAANWGVLPWWYYFNFFILQAVPPISILLLLFFFIGLYRNPKSIFTWCLVPFILAHLVVGHKEMRFLFPMAFGFIYLTAMGIDSFILEGKYLKTGRIVAIIIIIINVPLLLVRIITPAQEAMSYFKYIYNAAAKKEIVSLYSKDDVYELSGLQANFYRSPDIQCVIMKEDSEFSEYLKLNEPDSVFLFETNYPAANNFIGYNNESVYSLFPAWVLRFNIYEWESRARIWDIRELKKIK